MRKRFINISKRCMVAIMSAAFLMSSVTVSMAFPVGVYALEDPNPLGENEDVSIYETLGENNGTVDHNYGTVTVNNGIVDDNRGTVVTNNVTVNENYSSVTNSSTGAVQNNYYRGSVNGEGSVTNNYGGTVEDTVSVTNEFCYVALGESQGVLPSYSTGFVASPDGDQTYQFIQVKKDGSASNGTGTLVFTPSADHKITGTEGTTFDGNDSGVAFKYNITNNADGSCSVVLSDLKGSIRVDLATLNLLLSQIENNQINLGSIESTADMQELIDSLSDNDRSNGSQRRLTFTLTPRSTMASKVNIALMKRKSIDEVKVDLKTQSNLTIDEIRGLIETHNELSKNIYFEYEGKVYILHIPAIVLDQNYQNCLDLYANEENSQAGFMRVAEIFASLGVTLSEVITETQNDTEEIIPETPQNIVESNDGNATVNVSGTVLKSQISGAYSVENFEGFAVTTNANDIKKETGIEGTPFVRAYDITSKKSPAEFAVFNAIAQKEGATVLGAIQADFGQMDNGKFSDIPQTSIVQATISVANADGRKLAIVKVLPGRGNYEVIEDADDNDNTITFPITGGLASYAVIAYSEEQNTILGGRRGKASGGFNEG